jgi:hypothetical protein
MIIYLSMLNIKLGTGACGAGTACRNGSGPIKVMRLRLGNKGIGARNTAAASNVLVVSSLNISFFLKLCTVCDSVLLFWLMRGLIKLASGLYRKFSRFSKGELQDPEKAPTCFPIGVKKNFQHRSYWLALHFKLLT